MNVLAYLVTMANVQALYKTGGPIKDISIKVATLQSLMDDLMVQRGFNLENFRATGYYRAGTVGKYISKNVREYIFNGLGNPTDEGLMLTLFYKDAPEMLSGGEDNDKTLSFLLHRDAIEPNVKASIKSYLQEKRSGRNKRSLLVDTVPNLRQDRDEPK